MWWLSSSWFLKKNWMELILRFFRASVTWFWYRIALEGPVIGAGGHRMAFTPPWAWSRRVWSLYLHESDHAECRGVYIFNSKYWGKKSNRHLILYKKSNPNWIERKNRNRHITREKLLEFSLLVLPTPSLYGILSSNGAILLCAEMLFILCSEVSFYSMVLSYLDIVLKQLLDQGINCICEWVGIIVTNSMHIILVMLFQVSCTLLTKRISKRLILTSMRHLKAMIPLTVLKPSFHSSTCWWARSCWTGMHSCSFHSFCTQTI